MVYPNLLPPSVAENASAGAAGGSAAPSPHPPRIEYLATLSRHTAPVNVAKFSPHGEHACHSTRDVIERRIQGISLRRLGMVSSFVIFLLVVG